MLWRDLVLVSVDSYQRQQMSFPTFTFASSTFIYPYYLCFFRHQQPHTRPSDGFCCCPPKKLLFHFILLPSNSPIGFKILLIFVLGCLTHQFKSNRDWDDIKKYSIYIHKCKGKSLHFTDFTLAVQTFAEQHKLSTTPASQTLVASPL